MSKGAILGLSFLAIFIIGGPIASMSGSYNPLIGIGAGIITYIVLTALFAK